MENKNYIVLFDGVCNLCNSSVQRIIRNDPKAKFKFAALQSETAKKLLGENSSILNTQESIVLITPKNKIFTHSRAVLRIGIKMSFPYPLFGILFIFPYFIRDPFYNFISRNRYKWYGKQETCMIPSAEILSRFI